MRYIYKEIGKKIEKLRKTTQREYIQDKHSPYDQEEFIEELDLGIKRQTLGKIESGDEATIKNIKFGTLEKIADFFGVSIGYILGEYDSSTREIQDIHDVTGLSEEAISALIKTKTDGEFISRFLNNPDKSFVSFLKQLKARGVDTINEIELSTLIDSYNSESDEMFQKASYLYRKYEPLCVTEIKSVYENFLRKLKLGDKSNVNAYEKTPPKSFTIKDRFYNPSTLRIAFLNYLLSETQKTQNGEVASFSLLDELCEYVFSIPEQEYFVSGDQDAEKRTSASKMLEVQEELFKAHEENKGRCSK